MYINFSEVNAILHNILQQSFTHLIFFILSGENLYSTKLGTIQTYWSWVSATPELRVFWIKLSHKLLIVYLTRIWQFNNYLSVKAQKLNIRAKSRTSHRHQPILDCLRFCRTLVTGLLASETKVLLFSPSRVSGNPSLITL